MLAKLNFQHNFSSYKCHLILKKIILKLLFGAKKHKKQQHLFILKMIVLLNIFVETVFFFNSLIRKFKLHI